MRKVNTHRFKLTLIAMGFSACFLTIPSCSSTPGQNTPVIGNDIQRLPIIARVINFPAGKQNEGRIIFIVEIKYADLQFVTSSKGFESGVDYTFNLTEAEKPEKKQVIDSSQDISVATYRETIDKNKVLRITESFDVPVGNYIASVLVTGKNANSRGTLSHEVEARDFISNFTITEPFLTWDSVHTFQSEKLIPFNTANFERDFYAFVVIGGLDTTQTLSLVYKLQDNKNESLFERSVSVIPKKSSVLFSLPVPHEKLSLGTTALKIIARHQEQNVASSLNIRANFGYRPKRVKNFTNLIGPMRFIMSNKEYDELVNASSDKQTEIFNAYWAGRNPNPKSESNPLLEEFYYRVEMANARFSWSSGDGFESDRGRIMIKYGVPDAVQNTNRAGSTIAYEIWTYYDLGRRFIFIDKYNDGNYQLLSDSGA